MKTSIIKLSSLLLMLLSGINATAYDFMVDGLAYNINEDSTSVTLTYEQRPSATNENAYISLGGTLTIPSTVFYNGKTYSVTSIGDDAFYGCAELNSVTIGNSVTSIGFSAFYDCTSLTDIDIPNSVILIGGSAFDRTQWYDNQPNGLVYAGLVAYRYKGNMPSEASVTIKDGTKGIASGAFWGYWSLASVSLPNSITVIGEGAFSDCQGLKSVNIPNSVTTIGNQAFSDCLGLTEMVVPSSVISIGNCVFIRCNHLTKVTLENQIIGEYMFYACMRLNSVTISNSVASIGDGAFELCTGLNSIFNYINHPTDVSLGSAVFDGVDKSNCTLHVINGRHDEYSEADQWKDFLNIIDDLDGPVVPGDVDGNDTVNVSDVTTLVNTILGTVTKDPERADIDGNGNVNVSDVTALVNMILGVK